MVSDKIFFPVVSLMLCNRNYWNFVTLQLWGGGGACNVILCHDLKTTLTARRIVSILFGGDHLQLSNFVWKYVQNTKQPLCQRLVIQWCVSDIRGGRFISSSSTAFFFFFFYLRF
jgi:hypothetical protein